MRKDLLVAILAGVLFGVAGIPGGCDDEPAAPCEAQELFLTGGQTIPVGSVRVEDDGTTLTVTYETSGGWVLDEAHLHVACTREGIPSNGDGTVPPGQFAYAVHHEPAVTSHTFEVPLDSLDCAVGCGDGVVLALHGVVSNPGTGGHETAWASSFDPNDPPADADDQAFAGSQWGWYVDYTIACCDGSDEGGGGYEETVIEVPGETPIETPIE